jgi:hypothetical protein
MTHNEIKVYRSKDGTEEVHLNIWAVKMFEVEVVELAIAHNLVPTFRIPDNIFQVEELLPELEESEISNKLISKFDLDIEVAKSLISDIICSIPKKLSNQILLLKKKYFEKPDFYEIIPYRPHGDIIDTSKKTREELSKIYEDTSNPKGWEYV